MPSPSQSDIPYMLHREFSQDYDIGTVLGSYRLLELIGEGGMGRVFLAEHVRLGRKVAVKMLLSEYGGNTEAVRRFFAEARAVCQINHENIIDISDFIENDGGRSYYVMELLRGTDLAHLIKRDKALPLDRTIDIAVQVASALSAVHKAGIVHRDLKPDNIFLIERSGRKDFVKMLDFGVAKLLYDDAVTKTKDGYLIGTPGYMSPEQAAGQPVDHRTDIYALGVILFEMATGQTPFAAPGYRDLLLKHMTAPPPRPSQVTRAAQAIPPKLEKLILQCLAKDPSDRPQTMTEVADRLWAIAPTLSDFNGSGLRLPALAALRERRWMVLGGVAGVLCVGLAAALIASRGDPPRTRVTVPAAAAAPVRSAIPIPPAAPAGQREVPGTVEVTFISEPSGAEVFREGSDLPLGRTPLRQRFRTSDRSELFEIRSGGHEPVRRQVSLRYDVGVAVTLVPAKPGKGRGGRPPGASGADKAAKVAMPATPVPDKGAKAAAAPTAPPGPAQDKQADKQNDKQADPSLDRGGVLNPFQE